MCAMEDSLSMPLRDVLGVMQHRILHQTTYFGIHTLKSPIDFWVYQELVVETRPDWIVEIGNFCGGSALALAHLCDAVGKGEVIALDISHANVPDLVRRHPRMHLIEGDACMVFPTAKKLIGEGADVLVIEDSSHTFDNTLRVLTTYSALIRPGGYFIVEDGILDHGLAGVPHGGPYEAIEAFIRANPDFEIDRSRESFLITWNPKGYIRRIR